MMVHDANVGLLQSVRPRLIYACPNSNTPSGGVKVIYRHAALLSSMGYRGYIWHPGNDRFRCDWFDNSVDSIRDEDLSPLTDLIIVPEIWASSQIETLKNLGFKLGIFVQNSYMTHINLSPDRPNAIFDAYRDSDLVLSISEDNSHYIKEILMVPESKIILQRYAIDRRIFRPGNKDKIITYMPRKMMQHSVRVVSALQSLLPEGWSIQVIDKMTESQVADALSKSIIFLAFSEFEGLPVPPVEAALCGNIVIGYHGQGGKEYWRHPNFINVDQGDIRGFVEAALLTVEKVDAGRLPLDDINSGMSVLAEHFSDAKEIGFLTELAVRAESLFSRKY